MESPPTHGEAPTIPDEVEEDLTNEGDIPSPISAQALQDGAPVVKARPYQKEMLDESLKKNIIVAVGLSRCSRIQKSSKLANPCVDGYWEWKDTRVSSTSCFS